MKKLLSILLTLTLVLSIGIVGFAEGADPVQEFDEAGNPLGTQEDADWTEVKFKKLITTVGNENHPAETFNFTITSVSAKDEQDNDITSSMPVFAPATFSITAAEGNGEGFVTVELPDYTQVGTYVYKVQETAKNTAGMVYDTAEYEFTVVVLNDGQGQFKRLILKDAETGQKTDVFENEYKAGSLTVNKTITGNNADFNETFPVKVTLTAPGTEVINSTITVAGNEGTVVQTGNGTNEVVITFDVTDGSNVVISNIPAGVGYVVEETGLKGYTPTYTAEEGNISVNENIDATIVNDLSRDIETGINLDNLPYILLLAGAAIGLGALIVRKRRNTEY